MRNVLNKLARVPALIAALVLFGCVPTSENPIAGKTPFVDAQLIGVWRGASNDGVPIYLHFLKRKDGFTGALMVTRATKDDSDDEWSAFRLVTAEVSGQRYMSALYDFNNGKAVEGRETGYHLLRYTIGADGVLSLFLVNEDKLIAAVKAGKVEGKLEGDGTSQEVRLTASSAQLVKFLRHADPKDLFDQSFGTFTKVPQ